MNILVLADQEAKSLYDYYDPNRLRGIDLIISCGDLSAVYLEFFATLCHVPVLYIKGNHDGRLIERPPEGCIDIENTIYTYHGIRILGLGGSMRYTPNKPNQYTEKQMRARIRRLRFKLWRSGGIDILVTHAPAYHLNDMPDLPHMGFKCFIKLLEKYRPPLYIHGHVHATYGKEFTRRDVYKDTVVLNAYEYYVVEYPPDPSRKAVSSAESADLAARSAGSLPVSG